MKIEPETYKKLRAHFNEIAVHRTAENVIAELRQLPFVPFARVRLQLCRIIREINERRRIAGYETIPFNCIEFRRRVYRVFENEAASTKAA